MTSTPLAASTRARHGFVPARPANAIVLAIFIALQPLLFMLFQQYGHDNEEYLRFFEIRDDGPSYLEPLWLAYATAMNWLGFSSAESMLAGMACAMSLLAGYLLFRMQAGVKHPLRLALLLGLLLSYQVSALGGALRQGVSLFLICIFLVTWRMPALLLSASAHWSGMFYLPLLFRRITTAVAFMILAAASLTYFLLQSRTDIAFLGLLMNRLESYINIEGTAEAGRLLGLILVKAALGAILLSNRKIVLSTAANRQVGMLIIAAPFLQLLLALSNNMVVVDRGGMLLDPFVLVGTAILIRQSSAWWLVMISALILQKLATRLLILFITAS